MLSPGCPIARRFLNSLPTEVVESRRSNQKFALLFINLDNFKAVNETLGTMTATACCWCGTAPVFCATAVRYAGRIGGDEFVLLARNVHDPIALMAWRAGC